MVTNKEQFGFQGLKVRGITVHNTGNSLSARDNYESMQHSNDSGGCHFFADEREVVQAMPLEWSVYHTGMGKDWACKYTIAIEICRSQSDLQTYLTAEKKAVELIKQLMQEYKLTTSDIYFHNDFRSQTYCPHRIFVIDGNKETWIERNFK